MASTPLSLPVFRINNVTILKFLQNLERQAITRAQEGTKALAYPGIKLTGSDGRPMPETVKRLADKTRALLHGYMEQPTLEEEWTVAAGSPGALDAMVSSTSYTVAFLVYMEFVYLLNKQKLEFFVNAVDSVVLLGLHALQDGVSPSEVWADSFKVKAQDSKGIPILGADDDFKEILVAMEKSFYFFLRLKGLIEPNEDLSVVQTLTPMGNRAFAHLVSAMGASRSMAAQGPAIVKAEMENQQNMRGADAAMSALLVHASVLLRWR